MDLATRIRRKLKAEVDLALRTVMCCGPLPKRTTRPMRMLLTVRVLSPGLATAIADASSSPSVQRGISYRVTKYFT